MDVVVLVKDVPNPAGTPPEVGADYRHDGRAQEATADVLTGGARRRSRRRLRDASCARDRERVAHRGMARLGRGGRQGHERRQGAGDVDAPVGPDLGVLVGCGRGLGRENLGLLDSLARSIGEVAVGATRPVVDAGWAPFSRQIGQTGKTVQPRVYIAVGISGAPQHVIGVKHAHCILAINSDPAAPIFQLADLGVVGDARTVVTAVIERLEARRENR
jgi:hypothetical protein